MQQQLDEILIEEAKQDPEAFGVLAQRYQDRLFNFLYRMTGNRHDAEDLAQEVLIRVYRALPRFRTEAPFRPWLYKIATNVAINHLKAKRATVPIDDVFAASGSFNSPELSAEIHETQRAIGRAISEMPENYRAVILMRHIEELSYEEIAQALEVPLGTAKVRLHRARLMLQEKLVAQGVKDPSHELSDRSETASTLS
ncbi:MAG: sigma-70 family RNA polymerase sigma factor [Chloroflexota bacterium]